MNYVLAIIVLMALCGFWAWFQAWLIKQEGDEGQASENGVLTGCDGCEDGCYKPPLR
ncbi:MAG: hypothetical protein OEZ23_09615 [Gammaproteobacteria bacterium]|nr:hypothetical protein [Gammaproteobacteria bacterium]